MLKACSRCGRIHDFNYVCNVGRGRRYSNTDENKLRSKRAWQLKREDIKVRAFNLCEVCKDEGVYTYDYLSIHHVKKLRDDPSGLLDDNNLICLCGLHHRQADAGEISVEYLQELITKRDSGDY